jgi:hypothetical protein
MQFCQKEPIRGSFEQALRNQPSTQRPSVPQFLGFSQQILELVQIGVSQFRRIEKSNLRFLTGVVTHDAARALQFFKESMIVFQLSAVMGKHVEKEDYENHKYDACVETEYWTIPA